MGHFYCDICRGEYPDEEYALHVVPHRPITKVITKTNIPGADMEFIPEVERDEVTGEIKRPTFKQKPYTQLTDYGG